MIRSLYSGVSGLKNHQVKLDVISDNIANVNTTGFKASSVSFQSLMDQTIKNATENTGDGMSTNPAQVGIGSKIGSITASFSQGSAQYTGRPLDVLIDGNGFFAVQDNAGNVFYTRDGAFSFDNQGFLVNASGLIVLDSEGDQIQITEPIAQVSIDTTGKMTVLDEAGDVIAEPVIGVAKISNPESLLKLGSNLYRASTATVVPDGTEAIWGLGVVGTDGRGTIQANALEMSNVDLSTEFTSMIVAQRGYQANARVITTSDTMLEELINLKR